MSTQPEALRLAAALIERHGVESFEGDAAAELRRLHAEREACAKVCDEIAQRDETGYGIAEDCAAAIRAGSQA